MRSLIRCIATARACAVIGAPFTAGLAKTKGDFRAGIAIAAVISCIATTERESRAHTHSSTGVRESPTEPAKSRYQRFPLHACRRLRRRGLRSEARFSTLD